MPTFNSSNFIVETLDSVITQTYSNWELLITDDCSDDLTVDIILSCFKNESRIKIFVNKKNLGAAFSRNNSLSHATGDFIAFLDADDLWCPDKLEKQLEFMLINNYPFTYTAYKIIDENGLDLKKNVDLNNISFVSYEDMLKKKATMGCSTVMLKKTCFNDIQMPFIRTGQDYGTWLNLLKQTRYAYCYNEVKTAYRIVKGSISRNKLKKSVRQWSIYRKLEKLPVYYSIYCFFFYAYRAVFRK